MPQHIKIHTDFDITNTGVVRTYTPGPMPRTIAGNVINTEAEWTKLRRQQSNWETLIQIISLRTQPMNIHTVVNADDWTLEFDVAHIDVFKKGDAVLGLLIEDIGNVPLLTDLDEKKDLDLVSGEHYASNIRFETYAI